MSLRRILFAGLLASALVGCSKKSCTTPTVTAAVRAVVCQSGNGVLSLDGTGFSSSTIVQLDAGGNSFVATSVVANADGTHLDAQMPAGLEPGVAYDVVVSNGSCTDASPHTQITAVSGAFAFLTDPNVVYDAISTRVTVYATGLVQPLPNDAVQIAPTNPPGSPTTLAWTPVADHPNRVQVVVPAGQGIGQYDLSLTDGIGCTTHLADALRVTSELTVSLSPVDPPFGDQAAYTSITVHRNAAIAAPANTPFLATPRLFLNPTNPGPTDVAITLESVSYVDPDTLTAVVPPGQPAGQYDLVLVNPDGSVGVLSSAFRVQATPPPMIASVTPSSIVDQAGQMVTVAGTSFSADATVTVTCEDVLHNVVTPTATIATPVCTGLDCSAVVTIDGSAVPVGDACVLRIQNGDGSYFDYSAIGVTTSALNLDQPHPGTNLTMPRRALVAAGGNATASARFLYAIGGDAGASMASTPFASVEFTSVKPFGGLGTWQVLDASPLHTARSFAGVATLGRYIYVIGGSNGTTAVKSSERAMILDPVEAPHIDVDDMIPDATLGLDVGTYVYRVSALFGPDDVDNPDGESLASDELVVRVPALAGKKVEVVIGITPPTDRLGQPIPGVVGYRVYRSPTANGVSGDSVLLGTVPMGQTTFVDDGTATPGTAKPLPLGSLGKWRVLPDMVVAREGVAAAAARDPNDASTWYVYALLGRDDTGTPVGSYEYLTITMAANGHQTFASTWSGGSTAGAARYQLGAWVADATVTSHLAGHDAWVFVGGGRGAGNTFVGDVDAGHVQAGGALAMDTTPRDFASNRAGYGVCAANGQLFAFGGLNGAASADAFSAKIGATLPTLDPGAWNSEAITLAPKIVLMGSAVQSAFIFLLGGQTDVAEATAATQLGIW